MDVTRIEKHLKWFRLLDSFDSKRADFYGKYLLGPFVELTIHVSDSVIVA